MSNHTPSRDSYCRHRPSVSVFFAAQRKETLFPDTFYCKKCHRAIRPKYKMKLSKRAQIDLYIFVSMLGGLFARPLFSGWLQNAFHFESSRVLFLISYVLSMVCSFFAWSFVLWIVMKSIPWYDAEAEDQNPDADKKENNGVIC